MEKLTRMQQRIYDYIAETIREQGYPPSVREIGDAVGLKSPSTVHFHLKHLAELGVIGKEAGKGRAITLTNPLPREDQVPVVGSVAAGSPILAQECIEDYLTFDTGGRPGEFFALRVRGESMINAGILPGDLVVPLAGNAKVAEGQKQSLGKGIQEADAEGGEGGQQKQPRHALNGAADQPGIQRSLIPAAFRNFHDASLLFLYSFRAAPGALARCQTGQQLCAPRLTGKSGAGDMPAPGSISCCGALIA